jgi:hypothetical protein
MTVAVMIPCPHIHLMNWFRKMRAINGSEAMRLSQMIVGVLLIIIAPLVGVLPGPGGTIVFAIGVGLVLRNSLWAKRRYVVFKRKQPKIGGWADWGLRRQSARRRGEKAKQSRGSGD